MSTTMFVPMPEWQALLFLRDRETAFTRLVSRDKFNCLAEEVVPKPEGLYGFRNRQDAIDYGREQYHCAFAMVRFVMPGLLQGGWQLRHHVNPAVVPTKGTPLYQLDRDGLTAFRDACAVGTAEILVDQIFGSARSRPQAQLCMDGPCADEAPIKND